MIDNLSHVMFASLHGHPHPLVTRWNYSPGDPCAVSLSIHCPNGRWTEWLFSRELLQAGLTGRAGIGSVRLDRTVRCGNERLEVRIGCGADPAVLEFDATLVERFLDLSFDVVAAGAESAALDIDSLIAKLSGSWRP